MAGISASGSVAPLALEPHSRPMPRRAVPPERQQDADPSITEAVRDLVIDAVESAGSGDTATALRMANVATVLWSRTLRFDAADPRWPDRDRVVMSDGTCSVLLYALLHLTGHAGMGIDALRRHRQLDSPAAGHPEYACHPAVEATTGPLGQGLGMAVGFALAERMLAARFGRSLVDHRTWVIASDGDLMQGISQEAAGLAGELRLDRLTVFWDDSQGSVENGGGTQSSNDVLRRYAANGWTTRRIDGQDSQAITSAIALAVRSRKPTLVACRTPAGHALHRRRPAAFHVPPGLADRWHRIGTRGTPARRAWLKRLASHPLGREFDRVLAGKLPDRWQDAVAALKADFAASRTKAATRHSSEATIQALAPVRPALGGGSARQPTGPATVGPDSYAGRDISFGLREHGMAACLNGLGLHGGLVPFCVTSLLSTDYMRPAMRLAALMQQRVIFVLTHDSIGLGQDGAAHQPVEQLASLRAMPGAAVFRPADAIETAECWELVLRRMDGPGLLVLSQQPVPLVRADAGENRCARGGYVLIEADGPRQATLIASGSEVSVALGARRLLGETGIPAAVVSLPCWELFAAQDEVYRAHVLGAGLRVGIEAACGFGWERWLGPDGIFIGMTGYGASAPAPDLYHHFGITADAVAGAVRRRLQPPQHEGI